MSLPASQEAHSSLSLDCVPQCRRFTFHEIWVATKKFDESLVIGHGGFGNVYKGKFTNGKSVLDAAVKRLESTSNQGAEEFWAEVEMLSKLRHCNLVSLIGYCNDGNEMILVYDYMLNGTLSDHLYKHLSPPAWVRRLKISIGAARGLDYLHTGTGISQGVVHRDVKSSNILLDGSWASKVSDFGLSKIVPTNQECTHVNTLVKGTFGYLDPNYFQTSKLTRKSDVYAFGVILFELLCGRKALDTSLDDEEMNLAAWVQDSIKEGRLKQIVDSNLRGTMSSKCMSKFAQLANECLHSHPKKRPTMAQVVAGLESILALHEKTNKTLLAMDTKIFGIKVPAFGIPSSNENSVVGSSSKSLESYLYTVGGENRILRRVDFKTINIATEKFSRSNALSRSLSYGLMPKDPTTIKRQISGLQAAPPLIKGKLENGQDITVVGPYPHEQYECCMNQVSILVKAEHPNLAELSGWCIEQSNVYLIYDIPHNYATLEHVLRERRHAPFDWDERYKILLGVAQALLYLHKHAPVRVVYCDVKTRNILLDEGLNPKLHGSYFLASTTINETDCTDSNKIRRTRKNLAPEYRNFGLLSTKIDVYDFGMLVLETITGSSDYDYIWSNWVCGTYSNIIDSRISVDSGSIKRFIHTGLWCIQTEATNRPTMEEVVGMFLGSTSIHLPILKRPDVLRGYFT